MYFKCLETNVVFDIFFCNGVYISPTMEFYGFQRDLVFLIFLRKILSGSVIKMVRCVSRKTSIIFRSKYCKNIIDHKKYCYG